MNPLRGAENGTYSHAVMVRTHIHSDTSNRFTMESFPPDATYLFGRRN